MKVIDKDTLVAKIRNKVDSYKGDGIISISVLKQHCEDFIDSLDAIEVKEVDLEKELIEWHKEHFKKDGTFIRKSGFYLTNNSQMDIAKHFFKLGLKTQKGE